jgi:hypothetical protein
MGVVRVMAAVDGRLSAYLAAPLFRVSVSYIYKALGRRRATGDVTAHKSGGGRKPKLAAYDEALRSGVATSRHHPGRVASLACERSCGEGPSTPWTKLSPPRSKPSPRANAQTTLRATKDPRTSHAG